MTIYACQLVATDRFLGAASAPARRLARLVAYPISCTLFGVGGVIGAIRLLCGGSGVGKTEHRRR
ncbi:MAG: hypothetical protein ACRDRW_03820 [Pseudonocardiaceae bacterium]